MKLTELKEPKPTGHDWAVAMVKASGARIPLGPETADTGDGYMVTKARALKIIDALKAAGYKFALGGADGVVYDLNTRKRGMSLDFNDEDEDGKVGIRFFNDAPGK